MPFLFVAQRRGLALTPFHAVKEPLGGVQEQFQASSLMKEMEYERKWVLHPSDVRFVCV